MDKKANASTTCTAIPPRNQHCSSQEVIPLKLTADERRHLQNMPIEYLRALLAFFEAVQLLPGEASNTDAIAGLFARWKEAETKVESADDAVGAALAEYAALQNAITNQTPKTAREFAMWILAHTDRWSASVTDELRSMTNALAGETEVIR